MLGSGNNLSRGTIGLSSDAPNLSQVLTLEPIRLGNPSYTRSGELRRVLGVPSRASSEENSFGMSHPKPSPPGATEELKHFKESVQDTSREAGDLAKKLSESIFKLDKYAETLSSKKRRRNDTPPGERMDAATFDKVRNQVPRTLDSMAQRPEERKKMIGLNKRARTTVGDVRADGRVSTLARQQVIERGSDSPPSVSGETVRIEEKIRRLPVGGEGWEARMKRKRSVATLGNRVMNPDQRIIQAKPTVDSKLRSCDTQNFRLKSSAGVSGINRIESSFEPDSPGMGALSRNELETASIARDRSVLAEQRLMAKGNNKRNLQDDSPTNISTAILKGKVSRAPRTAAVIGVDSSSKVESPSGVVQGSSAHGMAQWGGQRLKNSRTRRTNVVSPVIRHTETKFSAQGFATSDFSPRASPGTTGSLSVVDSSPLKVKRELKNASSPYGLSESEDSGAGDNKTRERALASGDLFTTPKTGSPLLPVRKNKFQTSHKGGGAWKQGKNETVHGFHPVMVKSENLSVEKPLHNVKIASDKNRSKYGRPPAKKVKDRKPSTRLASNSSTPSNITGESDDDREDIFAAANSARKAANLACSGKFWKKMDHIFAAINTDDMQNIKDQLNFAEELDESLSEAVLDGYNIMGIKLPKTPHRICEGIVDYSGPASSCKSVPWFEEEQIANVICKYYANLFKANQTTDLHIVEEALRPCVSSQINEALIQDPSAAEIREATFAIHPDKAPGPDGFSASFFQANWEVVGPAVIKEVQLFFTTGVLRPAQNVTHVRLIPKTVGAKKVADYRPIALCNVFFKIISKLLALRLKTVLHLIISENQSAFIPGRAIADNILITHEVLQFLKISQAQKRCTMAVKTDMSKTYDRIEWGFIEKVLQRLGFHSKWSQLIMQCVSTVSYSYLINDSVHGSVTPQRGIRQGDPLSPYLFILCGQVLSGLCQKAEKEGTLQGIRVARGSPRVNHLLFADDTMFFCQTSPASCAALSNILKEYELASGQKINSEKSSITFSSRTPEDTKRSVKEALGIVKEGGQGKYLGLPEHFGRRKKDLFTTLVDRIRQRASSYSTRHLSKAGKLTMLKAVLTAIPTFTMSCFELPVSLCKRIQSVLTRFWWDSSDGVKKMCWVAWDRLTMPKAGGGLGLRDIQLFNQALLAKQAWRILTNPNCLLARVLLGKYCHNKSFMEVSVPAVCSHGWRSILHGRELLRDNVGKALGNGLSTKVWKDSWISLDKNTKPYGPIQESALDLTVSDLLTSDMKWNKSKVEALLPLMAKEIQLLNPGHPTTEDIHVWQPLQSGKYTTKSGYYTAAMRTQSIQEHSAYAFDWIKDIWNAKCSPKVQLFMWSIIQEAIPLGENLRRRGIQSEALCIRCKGTESAMHIFFNCPFAQEVWKLIPLRQVVHLATETDFKKAVIACRRLICLPPTGVSTTILPWMCWVLWTARNTLLFEKRTLTPEEIATKAVRLAREWINAQPQKIPTTQGLTQARRTHRIPTTDDAIPTCKSDAAFDAQSKKAGLAWIIREESGTTISQGSKPQGSVNSPLIAEALALRAGIIDAVKLELSKLRMLSDNSTLIRAINNDAQVKEIFGIVKDIQKLSSVFVEISFAHVPRSSNVEADRLAKLALSVSVVSNP